MLRRNCHPRCGGGRRGPMNLDWDELRRSPMTKGWDDSRRLRGEGRRNEGEPPSMETQRLAELAWLWLRGRWADR
jgi:hypothetical protein